ncbi:MAG: hypothetical protein ACJ75J_06070 [Cytophagaceae bacterium]
MRKAIFHIFPTPEGWELNKEGNKHPIITDMNGKDVLMRAMTEATMEPSEIVIYSPDGLVMSRIYQGEELFKDELDKRDDLIKLVGNFLKDVIKAPSYLYRKFLYYININDLYQHMLGILSLMSKWGADALDKKIETDLIKDEAIVKRDNIVYMVGKLLEYNELAPEPVYNNFYNYLYSISFEDFYSKLLQLTRSADR